MRNSAFVLAATAAFLGLVAGAMPAGAGEVPSAANFAAAQASATKEGRPVLVKFSTEW